MHKNRSSGRVVHAAQSADVIDVRVSNHNRSDVQIVPLNHVQNSAVIFTGIDDDRLASLRVTDDWAIALQHSDRKDFVDQLLRISHDVPSRPRALMVLYILWRAPSRARTPFGRLQVEPVRIASSYAARNTIDRAARVCRREDR